MSIEQDIVPLEQIERTEEISKLMERVSMLALQVAVMSDNGDSSYEIYSKVRDELVDLNEDLSEFPEVDYCYSGPGFCPIVLPDGDNQTVYSPIRAGRGKFNELVIADSANMSYLIPEEIDMYFTDFVEEAGDVLTVGDQSAIEAFKEGVQEPPTGDRLYIEMLQDTYDGADATLAGSSVRAERFSIYHILDACEFTLDYIVADASESAEPIPIYDLEDYIVRESRTFRTLLKSTPFRRSSREEQLRMLGNELQVINGRLGLDRVSATVAPKEYYVPDVSSGSPELVRKKIPEHVGGFMMMPLQIDSPESLSLTNGNRIYRDGRMLNPRAGFYMVGQVDTYTREKLGIDTPVVWIPVIPKDFSCAFLAVEDL